MQPLSNLREPVPVRVRVEREVCGFAAVETLSPRVATLLVERELAQRQEIARLRGHLGEAVVRLVVPLRRSGA